MQPDNVLSSIKHIKGDGGREQEERTIIRADHFSIEQICNSGQCFRMIMQENGRCRVIARDRCVELEQDGQEITFFCSRQEYEQLWNRYFDLDLDYGAVIRRIDPKDRYLTDAARCGSGIRILNQDLWEMVVTFIISQQNNIRRIRKCVEIICEKYGADCGGFYRFPTPEELAEATEAELRAYGLGYRSPYLVLTARMAASGEVSLEQIREMDYGGAREELLRFPGVGGKVADCICLFALHHLDAFPIDTHIRRVLDTHYPEGFPAGKYEGILGILQQYLFFYDLAEKNP